MPSDTSRTLGVIGSAILQIFLLPVNFVIWLVTSPELITLLCILSEILIELVVSAVMAGVSIIVSAVILMEDEPEPTLITTIPSYKKKSFLHGGDPDFGDPRCETVLTKEDKVKAKDEDEDRKSVDKTAERRASSSRAFLDSWLPKFGAPRGEATPAVSEPLTPVEESEPESILTQASDGEQPDEDVKLAAESMEEEVVADLQLAGEENSLKADSEKADNEYTGSEKADSGKADNEESETGSQEPAAT